jgi:hypothetical protein
MIKLSGKIKNLQETISYGNEKKFDKRVFWLQEATGEYPNCWLLEFWQDDCKMGDSLDEGDYVTCFIDIKGKIYTKKDGSGESVINSLKCWNIEKDGKAFKEIKK